MKIVTVLELVLKIDESVHKNIPLGENQSHLDKEAMSYMNILDELTKDRHLKSLQRRLNLES